MSAENVDSDGLLEVIFSQDLYTLKELGPQNLNLTTINDLKALFLELKYSHFGDLDDDFDPSSDQKIPVLTNWTFVKFEMSSMTLQLNFSDKALVSL